MSDPLSSNEVATDDLPGDVPGLQAEIDRLTARVADLEDLFDMDDAWPLHDVLAKLIEATEHLLSAHQCDTHRHEEFRYAVQRGSAILTNVRTTFTRQPVETTGEHT